MFKFGTLKPSIKFRPAEAHSPACISKPLDSPLFPSKYIKKKRRVSVNRKKKKVVKSKMLDISN